MQNADVAHERITEIEVDAAGLNARRIEAIHVV